MLRRSIARWCSAGATASGGSGSSQHAVPLKAKLQVAIVGSGPSGCYTADHLLKRCGNAIHVDVYDRMPVPFGLVRYGVAPDHPEVKNVQDRFLKMFTEDKARVTWLGNVDIGRSLTIRQLQDSYHAVVIATGADNNNTLRIPNEDLANIFSARTFVNYYNTMPIPYCNSTAAPFKIEKVRRATIIGNGNVALDVARALGAYYKHWAPTDMNCRAIRDLMGSEVEEIDIIARRGEEHAAFTTAEFREIASSFPASEIEVRLKDFDLDAALARSDGSRARKRMLELMHKYTDSNREATLVADAEKRKKAAEAAALSGDKSGPAAAVFGSGLVPAPSPQSESAVAGNAAYEEWAKNRERFSMDGRAFPMKARSVPRKKRIINFLFNMKPVGFVPKKDSPNFVGGVQLEVKDPATGEMGHVICPTDVVFTSVGYRSEPVKGVPFDDEKGVVPNVGGRVCAEAPSSDTPKILPNLYCTGWVKRGPKGVILHAMMDAQDTAAKVLEDFGIASVPQKRGRPEDAEAASAPSSPLSAELQPRKGKFELLDYLIQKEIVPLGIKAAQRILKAERERGVDLGKCAEKMGSVKQMVEVAMGGAVGVAAERQFRGLQGGKPVQSDIMSAFLDDETDMRTVAAGFSSKIPHTMAGTEFVSPEEVAAQCTPKERGGGF